MNVNPLRVAVPPGVVRLISPLAPLPTMATTVLAETTVNDDADVLPNDIDEVLSKFDPVMVINVPVPAAVG